MARGAAASLRPDVVPVSVGTSDVLIERAEAVAAEIEGVGGDAVRLKGERASVGRLGTVGEMCLSQFGRVDIVVNNVAVPAVGKPEAIPIEEWQKIIDINLWGIIRS